MIASIHLQCGKISWCIDSSKLTIITKPFHFFRGFLLWIIHSRSLDINGLLKGKRVAIIGAASSAFHTGKGEYIDGFDIVIRINKAPMLLQDGKWKDDIGSRTDILFHSFYENMESGGGPLDFKLYDSLGIKYIVNPVAAYKGYRVTFNFYKKYLSNRIVYSLHRKVYRGIQEKLGNFQPTIGFCALLASLQTDFTELYLTGFTFFRTPFGDGYRNQMKESVQVQNYIKKSGLHDPDLECKVFSEILGTLRHRNVIMDDALKSIIQMEQRH